MTEQLARRHSLNIKVQRFFRPTWAEVNLGRLRRNLLLFKSKLHRRTKLMFVVKGNAYGHGATEISKEAQKSGAADWLGVSSVEEGISLREAGVTAPILVLGSLYPFDSFRAAIRHDLTPTVASLEAARQLAQSARGMIVRCHLKLDTGMGRIGMKWPSGMRVVQFIAAARNLDLDGVYTHFARADSSGGYTRLQLGRFQAALTDIRKEGIRVRHAHAANSAAALNFPETRLDMVRPGLAIYGLFGKGFEAVLSLKSKIVFIKNVERGTSIGYGTMYRTRRTSRIATLPIGYADGYPRALSNRADVLVHGKRCPVVGAISMDMTMVDVTNVPHARVGDEIVLIGKSGRHEVGVAELAGRAGTIPYEVVTSLSQRVPRVYVTSEA